MVKERGGGGGGALCKAYLVDTKAPNNLLEEKMMYMYSGMDPIREPLMWNLKNSRERCGEGGVATEFYLLTIIRVRHSFHGTAFREDDWFC